MTWYSGSIPLLFFSACREFCFLFYFLPKHPVIRMNIYICMSIINKDIHSRRSISFYIFYFYLSGSRASIYPESFYFFACLVQIVNLLWKPSFLFFYQHIFSTHKKKRSKVKKICDEIKKE